MIAYVRFGTQLEKGTRETKKIYREFFEKRLPRARFFSKIRKTTFIKTVIINSKFKQL